MSLHFLNKQTYPSQLVLVVFMLLTGLCNVSTQSLRHCRAAQGRVCHTRLPSTTSRSVAAAATATTRMKYRAPIVRPAKEKHTGTVIVLHGLGDSGDGWSDVASQFGPALPYAKFVFPHAPTRPISLNGGYPMPGWFDILSLTGVNDKEDTAGLLESCRYVEELVAAEGKAGIPSERVVVAGFSQGGAIALLMLKSDVKLGGVIGLSTWLPMRDSVPHVSQANKNTPVLMGHGDSDQVVRYVFGQQSADKLKAEGSNVQFKTYCGMGHSASPPELADITNFLKQHLPPV